MLACSALKRAYRNRLRVSAADLEKPKPDEDVLTIELGRTPEEVVEAIKAKLHLATKE